MSAIEFHRLEIVMEHCSEAKKCQVSVVQTKKGDFLVYKFIFDLKRLKNP